ncbi:hypothetical protein ABGB12_30215 [Actinocorallia sp. B10E7]|uniref:hypothetical protein n=1 Tax=Actinocorallia sp. B10E7 TaxID=3153558 RepID=UPI00325E9D75
MSDRMARLWPFALAIAMAASMPTDDSSIRTVLTDILLLLPLVYLVAAKTDRREASWPALLLLTGSYVLLRALDLVAPSTAFAAIALAMLVWGTFDGALRDSRAFRTQTLGMIAFGSLALAGLLTEPDLGRHLIAAGWFLHGLWDFVHLKKDAVVSRSYAKWCGTLDVLVAAQLVLLS